MMYCSTHKGSVSRREISVAEVENAMCCRLDVYVPEAAVFERRQWPVVLFVHGGIWASGSKELFSHVGACLANYGVLAVVVQYTLFPQVT